MIRLHGEDNQVKINIQEINNWLQKPASELPVNMFAMHSETRSKQLFKACVVGLLCLRLDKPNMFETNKKLRLFCLDDISDVFTQKEADWIIQECDSRGYTHLGCELIAKGIDPSFEILTKCKHMDLFYTCNVLTVDLPSSKSNEPDLSRFEFDDSDDYSSVSDHVAHSGVSKSHNSIGVPPRDTPAGVPSINNTGVPSLKVYKAERNLDDLMMDPKTECIDQPREP